MIGDNRIGSRGQIESAIYVANATARLALTGLRDGQLVLQIDTNALYSWDLGGSAFILVGSGLVTAISDTNSIDLTETTGTLTADVKIQDTTSVDLAIDGSGLKATVLPAGVDHNSLANTHNLTTSIDHNSINNTHNLTTNIDHNSITNTHNLTTSIDHNSITNTHNLTTNIDHGSISGLGDDDHSQYHNDTRGDSRYFQKTEHLATSAGSGDAGKPIKLDSDGQIDATMINDGDISHGSLAGTHNLTTDISHSSISNTHNLTTDIDHNSIANTHNLTTSIDHNSITNTHNLTTSIDHNSITNTHNLTTNIDHTSISNIGTNSHATIDSHIGASTAHGVSGSVVGTSDTQALTNKDINGGTASDTNRITLPKNTLANLTGLTRKQATIAYDTTNDKVVFDNGSTLTALGSGSGGSATQFQDFTTVSSIGSSSQQYAGHIPIHSSGGYNDPNSPWSELLAYYKFGATLTADETTTYDLTNNGTVVAANGIMNTAYGCEFNGSSNYFTQAGNLLDSAPTNGLAIDFWFKPDDGQPSGRQVLFIKFNDESGGSEDRIRFSLETNGHLQCNIAYAGTGATYDTGIALANGSVDWQHVALNWSTSAGLKIWVNSNLEVNASSATTYMSDGSARDFCIGCNNGGGSTGEFFDGKMCNFRIRDKVLTQADMDIAYAVQYTNSLSDANVEFNSYVQLGGDSDLVRNYDFSNVVVCIDSSYVYRAGGLITGLSSTDKLKILGRL